MVYINCRWTIDNFTWITVQDSIRNSADAAILCSPDSLTILIAKDDISGSEEYSMNLVSTPRKVQSLRIGANDLDFLKFSYKVCL